MISRYEFSKLNVDTQSPALGRPAPDGVIEQCAELQSNPQRAGPDQYHLHRRR